jgi:hypothetical protein
MRFSHVCYVPFGWLISSVIIVSYFAVYFLSSFIQFSIMILAIVIMVVTTPIRQTLANQDRNMKNALHSLAYTLIWWSSTRGTRRHFTSIKTKHRNRLNLEPALILALRNIRPRIELLPCQKQAQSSH